LLDVEDFSFGSSNTSSDAPSETEPEAEPVAATDAIDIDEFVAEPVATAEAIDIDDFAAEPVVAAEAIDIDDFAAEPVVAAEAIDIVDFAAEPVVAAEAIDIDDFANEPDVESGSLSDEQVPEPSVELATDVILGLPDDSPTPVESLEVSGFEAEESPVAGEDLTRAIDQLEGLETFSLDAPVETTAETSDEPVVADAPDTFATETMAELYAQQGHIESAMDIYGQLLERSPNDEELRRRASEVERQARDAGDEVAPPAEAVEEAPLIAGPTIRDFFRELLDARAVQAAFEETPAESVASLAGSTSYEPEGSLDILFSEVATDEADDSAAMSLAQAFGSEKETSDDAALQGTPAHPASDELSLDHVFRSATPAKGSGTATGFSLDQFFSGETANGELPNGSNENSPRSSDDIAQFNAWLNGLKKT